MFALRHIKENTFLYVHMGFNKGEVEFKLDTEGTVVWNTDSQTAAYDVMTTFNVGDWIDIPYNPYDPSDLEIVDLSLEKTVLL